MPQSNETTAERLERLEQNVKDASNRVSEMLALNQSLIAEIRALEPRLANAEAKLRRVFPEVENCPKCHRKINPGARNCMVCGHVW